MATRGYRVCLPSQVSTSRLVHQLQGDFMGAKQGFEQSLAIWQKNGDQLGCRLWQCGDWGALLLAGGRFSGCPQDVRAGAGHTDREQAIR